MGRQPGFFDVEERLRELSAKGDDLERLNALVEFEAFRPELERAVPRSDRAKGGRPPYDHVLMFKVLILQASHSLSDERTEYLIKDRLSFMRFLGLSLSDRVPDANSIWNFREGMTRARIADQPAIEILFRRFDAMLQASGYIAMGGQIIDATMVAAPKQRNTEDEKRALKEGRIPEAWRDRPAKLAQKDRDARWTIKHSKAKPAEDGAKRVDITVPLFGYKNHLGIDRRHGLIRSWAATDAARHAARSSPTSSTRPTPGAGSGPIPPTAPRRTRRFSRRTASRAASIARNHRASRCRNARRGRTRRSPRSAPTSSTSSPGRRGLWPSSSAPSAWSGRG